MIVSDARRKWLLAAVPALLMLVLAALELKRLGRLPETPSATQAGAPLPAPVPASAATPGGNLPHVNAARAMQYVREVVAFGPRPIGSTPHKKLEAYLTAHLKGTTIEHDEFVASTPEGSFPIHNIIAKFPGTRPGAVVIATHYDTLMRVKNFVGANDGGSGTGLLLELANQLRGAKPDGHSVWLVWLDGEESVRQWSETDSLYGSRHLAEKWQKDGTISQVKAFLLADMIGDADLNIDRDQNSTAWLEDMVYQAAIRLGYQSHFFVRSLAIEDDHIPFAKAGVPVADLIDFDYGYNNVFWHTTQDTLDKLRPKSLEITGDVLLETVRLLDQLSRSPSLFQIQNNGVEIWARVEAEFGPRFPSVKGSQARARPTAISAIHCTLCPLAPCRARVAPATRTVACVAVRYRKTH